MSYTFGRGSRTNESIREAAWMIGINEHDLFVYVRSLPGETPEDVHYRIGQRLIDAVEDQLQGVERTDRAAVCEALGIRPPKKPRPEPAPTRVPRPGKPRPGQEPKP